jgi:DNA-binding PadR family transcriptional regulator
MQDHSILGYALLGLLHQQPMSGYDLRKVFSTTAMGSFSDSPGAIYPALYRLETRGWVRGQVQPSASMRKRRVFGLTPKGLVAFKAWLMKRVTRDDVIRRVGELMLRFAFMDYTLGADPTIQFLRSYAEGVSTYLPELKQYLDAHSSEMPLSGRLALGCGIAEYEARLRWARTSFATYEQRKRNGV